MRRRWHERIGTRERTRMAGACVGLAGEHVANSPRRGYAHAIGRGVLCERSQGRGNEAGSGLFWACGMMFSAMIY